MGDPQRARLLLERALRLLPEKSPGYAAATVELAAAGWNLLSEDEVERLLSAGADLAAELGLRALELRARILRLGAVPEGYGGDPLGVLAETNAALGELEALDDPRALASALCTLASVECALGRAADAVASASRALDVLRAADEDTVWALENLVWAAIESPMPIPAVETLLAQLLDELGVRPTVRSNLIRRQAELAQLRGRADEALRLLAAAGEIERDLGRDMVRNAFEVRGGDARPGRKV
jgi:tetratricopeptide (TPR) repeat protein